MVIWKQLKRKTTSLLILPFILTGLMISSVCDNEMSAMHLALGSLMPNLLFSGVMWPMEGMPIALKYMAYSMPMTYAIGWFNSNSE